MSRYAERVDIEFIFGADNVKKWADLDNDENDVKIANRIDEALNLATVYIDDRLRGGPYKIPFTTEGDGSSSSHTNVPRQILDACARYAGVKLYESRGITDFNREAEEVDHQLSPHIIAVKRFLNNVMAGVVRLDTKIIATQIPKVV